VIGAGSVLIYSIVAMQEPYSPMLRLLADIKNALNRLVETIAEHEQSDSRETEQETETELQALVRLPEEVTEYYRSEQRDRPVKNRHETIRMVLESAAVIAAVGLAILTLCTLVTLNGQSTQMQHQTCIQQQAAINAERAWVGLAQTPQVDTGSLNQKRFTADIGLSLKNFGHGPAFNVFAVGRFATHGHVQEAITSMCNAIFPFVGLKPTVPVTSSESIQGTQWGQILFPDQPPFATSTSWGGESSEIIGQEVFIVGCIVYKDQFGSPHWTKFSYSTGPFTTQVVRDASSFRHLYVSSGNNYTDDAEKKPSCPN
jgi:hypothetical protein